MNETRWGNTVAAFSRYQQSPASRLRYQQAQQQILELCPLSPGQTALDAAGGNGMNSAFLIHLGASVTLLDADAEMLEDARRVLGAVAGDRLTLQHGSVDEAEHLLKGRRFDLITLHHILEYLPRPDETLRRLSTLANAGGRLSLITLNPVSEVVRAMVFKHDAELAHRRLGDLRYDAKWFGNAMLYTLDTILGWATEAGWELKDFRGMRVLSDYVPDSEMTPDKEAATGHLEALLAKAEPYRRFGRYLHFVFTHR